MKNKSALCFLSGMKIFNGLLKPIIVLLLLILFGFGGSVFAQDILIMKSGKELKVNIIEENDKIVKYREYENPAGPLYQVTKDKVASVKYKNGSPQQEVRPEVVPPAVAATVSQEAASQELSLVRRRYIMLDGKSLSNKAVKTVMASNPEALGYYVSGKKLLKTSNAFLYSTILSAFISSFVINNAEDDASSNKAAITGVAISGTFFLAAIVTVSAGKSKVKKSIRIYNSALDKPVSYRLDFGLQENGIGIALRF